MAASKSGPVGPPMYESVGSMDHRNDLFAQGDPPHEGVVELDGSRSFNSESDSSATDLAVGRTSSDRAGGYR